MIRLFYKAAMPVWLLLIHQIPPKPSYFRVKIWRRLQRLGAVGIKNSVYALPSSDQALEDFNWVLRRKGQLSDERRVELEAQLTRLQKKAAEIAAVDFFDSRGRETAGGLLAEIAERLAPPPAKPGKDPAPVEKPRGRTWVTRTGIHVDRMASAWLIRRFIDPDARFRFVATREYRHQPASCASTCSTA